MKVLIVRAWQDARRTAARLAARGHAAVVSPVLEVRRLSNRIPDANFDAVVATSAHAFDARSDDALKDVPVFVVGERTAEAAQRAGLQAPTAVAANAGELIGSLRDRLRPGACLLYLVGRDRKPDVEDALGPQFRMLVVDTYAAESASELNDAARTALARGEIDAVLHYSRRSAAIFCDLAGRSSLGGAVGSIRHIAISADAATPLVAAGWNVEIAGSPDEEAMIRSLEDAVQDKSRRS